MAVQRDADLKLYRCGRTVCGVLTHVMCAGLTGCVTLLAKPGTSVFSWHPFLMSVSFFLMTEGVVLLKGRARLHWLLQSASATCAALGLATIFYNKHLQGKPHFVTWHGLVGVAGAGLLACQCLGGVSLLYPKLGTGWTLAKRRRYHAAAGLVTYLVGGVSLVLGVSSGWFRAGVSGYGWYLAALCPVVCSLAVMSQVTSTYLGKKTLRY